MAHTHWSGDDKIQLLIEAFDNMSREHYKTNIVEYWKQQQRSRPELYRLAQVLLAIPATQVMS